MRNAKDSKQIRALLRKVDKAIALLSQIRGALGQEADALSRRRRKAVAGPSRLDISSQQELKAAYEHLLTEFRSQGPAVTREFVGRHPSSYLDSFIRANNLPVSPKSSKSEVEEALRQALIASLVVRGEDQP